MKSGVGAFFSASESREERWRELHRAAKALAAGGQGDKAKQEAGALLKELAPLEELCGYPGPALMAQVNERAKSGDGAGLARLTQRISISLLSNSYRDDPEAWKSDEEGDPHMPKVLPPSIGRGQARKPYCEVLVVTPAMLMLFTRERRDPNAPSRRNWIARLLRRHPSAAPAD